MWKGQNIHLSTISLFFVCLGLFFCFFTILKVLYTIQTPIFCFYTLLSCLTDPRNKLSPSTHTPNYSQLADTECVFHCAINVLYLFIYIFFYTLHVLIKARTKIPLTCIWADTVFQTQEADKDVKWLFFYGN